MYTTELGFVRDRLSCIVLRDYWCNIIVLNVHAPREEKIDDSQDSFHEELGQVFDNFPTYQMQILLEILVQKCGERISSNRQLGMGVYIRIVMITVL